MGALMQFGRNGDSGQWERCRARPENRGRYNCHHVEHRMMRAEDAESLNMQVQEEAALGEHDAASSSLRKNAGRRSDGSDAGTAGSAARRGGGSKRAPLQNHRFPLRKMHTEVVGMLEERGITMDAIAESAYEEQSRYGIPYTVDDYRGFVDEVMHNPNVLSLTASGLALDDAVMNGTAPESLSQVMRADMPCYGVDEMIALSIANTYHPIGMTNYGYMDCAKTGISKKLDLDKNHVNVFADDIATALVACTEGLVMNKLVEREQAGLDEEYYDDEDE